MAQQVLKVPPTKNTLLALKKQTKFLEEGHDLLERKRELLTRLVYERIGEYRRLRAEAETGLEEAYRCLSITHLRMGSRGSAPGRARFRTRAESRHPAAPLPGRGVSRRH